MVRALRCASVDRSKGMTPNDDDIPLESTEASIVASILDIAGEYHDTDRGHRYRRLRVGSWSVCDEGGMPLAIIPNTLDLAERIVSGLA
jgi:hypothetical protein